MSLQKLQETIFRPRIISFPPEMEGKKGKGFTYKGREYVHHSNLHHKDIAFHRLSSLQIYVLTVLFIDLILAFIINWHATLVVIVAIMTFLYFADLLFNLYLVYRSFSTPSEIKIDQTEMNALQSWPTYTVFCPLYKEWQVLPQFIQAMSELDYPKDQLQVMLLLEEDDAETIRHIKTYALPKFFDIVIVPHSFPKTKPKAMNYGLKFSKGEFIVIYDAEDIPDPLQLKKAVVAFQKGDQRIVCIQAKLNFYNPHQNLLTKVFTAEYSLWFDLVLTGLQSIHAPIPLGGTSNHFRTADLNGLKGWDSFNVTEDADLGMRLVKQGYQTAMIDSVTLEEANSNIFNWFGQRTRWIKGYIQTYFVHTRGQTSTDAAKILNSQFSMLNLISFHFIIGGKILSMIINPVMWVITIAYFVMRTQVGPFIESFFPTPILYMGVFSLILGNFLYIYYYMIGCAKHGHDELVKYGVLVPFYWLMMSVASWMALYKFIAAPHYWSKTTHGLHLAKERQPKIAQMMDMSIFEKKMINLLAQKTQNTQFARSI